MSFQLEQGDSPGAEVLVSADGHRNLTSREKALVAAEVNGLHQRLETLPVIEQSKGVLMGHFGVDADGAFALLRRWSSLGNVKLRDVSRLVVEAATDARTQGRESLGDLLQRLESGAADRR